MDNKESLIDEEIEAAQKGSPTKKLFIALTILHLAVFILCFYKKHLFIDFLKSIPKDKIIEIAYGYIFIIGFWVPLIFILIWGADEEVVRNYIKEQEKEDQRLEQLTLPTGS